MPPKQKNSTPIKPLEGSTMTHESEDIQNEISKLEKRLDELEGLMIKKEDLVNSQRNMMVKMENSQRTMEDRMENSQRNMEDRMERKIDKLKISIQTWLSQNLNERTHVDENVIHESE